MYIGINSMPNVNHSATFIRTFKNEKTSVSNFITRYSNGEVGPLSYNQSISALVAFSRI